MLRFVLLHLDLYRSKTLFAADDQALGQISGRLMT